MAICNHYPRAHLSPSTLPLMRLMHTTRPAPASSLASLRMDRKASGDGAVAEAEEIAATRQCERCDCDDITHRTHLVAAPRFQPCRAPGRPDTAAGLPQASPPHLPRRLPASTHALCRPTMSSPPHAPKQRLPRRWAGGLRSSRVAAAAERRLPSPPPCGPAAPGAADPWRCCVYVTRVSPGV